MIPSCMADEHECDICGQSFDTEEALKEHAQKEHEDEMCEASSRLVSRSRGLLSRSAVVA